MDDVVINPDVMTKDAEDVWQNASTQMLGIKHAAPDIAIQDFSLVFDCITLWRSYRKAMNALGDYVDAGSTEFLRFEKNLLESVVIYGKSHGAVSGGYRNTGE